MIRKTLIVIGAGGHGRIVAETAQSTDKFSILGFADDSPEKQGLLIDGLPVLGSWKDHSADLWVIGLGNADYRRSIGQALRDIEASLATVISPKAVVSPHAEIGEGTVILAGAIIQAGATIGRNVIVNAGAVVDHDARVGDFAHLKPNAVLGSFKVVGEGEVLEA